MIVLSAQNHFKSNDKTNTDWLRYKNIAHIGVDWIRDNDELYLAGDWLTQCGLTGQPLALGMMPSKVIMQIQQDNVLANNR